MKSIAKLVSLVASLVLHNSAVSAASTSEIFSFKGVPLDTPGVIDALRSVCLQTSYNQEYGQRVGEESPCSGIKAGTSQFFTSYGSLAEETGSFLLSDDLALLRVEFDVYETYVVPLAQSLAAKYGTPVTTSTEVQNKLGATFDKETMVWTDSRGSRITLESMFERVSVGRLTIESAGYVATLDAAKQTAIEHAKDNL